MDEDEDVFEDTVSVNSNSPIGKEFISLSRVTIYHSAEDLHSSNEHLAVEEDCTLVDEPQALQSTPVDKPNMTMFNDSNQSVDFVLVWTDHKQNGTLAQLAAEKRTIFEKNLMDDGLCLEKEDTLSLHFVKIHAPRELLCRYTEIMKLRMPMKHLASQVDGEEPSMDIMGEVKSYVKRFTNWVRVDPSVFKPKPHKLTAEFCRDKNYLFDVDSEDFFSSSIRTLVVDFILQRMKFTEGKASPFCFGINRLITEGVYTAAYPLHDGNYRVQGCLRNQLYTEWASVRKWIMYQPVDYVKDYFGVKYGLYFAWLGFYTHMLIPAAVLGVICFIYGWATLYYNTFSEDVCNSNITMCPLCDNTCHYWQLKDSCTYARVTYLFDNSFTVFFAVFMSFWATLFLELWKRYSAAITHEWGLTGFDLQTEHPRPEYVARLNNSKTTKTKVNVATKLPEPYAPFWKVRVPATIFSFSIMLLLICVAVGAVFGVVLYRMSVFAAFSLTSRANDTDYILIFIPVTAALINLVCIMALNYVYDFLAVKLTEYELLRTQAEFDDSLTLKIYLFQFVNYYTSIFYIAFLKGKFVGYPMKYNRIFDFRQEECGPGGCLMELCIQLAIIMVGKQAMNTILEMVVPLMWKWINTIRIKTGLMKADEEEMKLRTQWAADYKLLELGPRGLFGEYLEMVLQYGFVTIFVAAFPLAPLFALLNNVLEMRLDAKKFLRFYRRPVPHRVKDIGVWFRILDILGHVSVVTNAFIIAFSSNFIPRLVYMNINKAGNHTDVGFLNFSLAYFNTSDFPEIHKPDYPNNFTECRYAEYRNPPDYEPDHLRYKRPLIYWHIMAARLAFIVVFQNVVGFVMMAVQWLIPDQSRKVRDEIRREAYLTNEEIIKHETLRARGLPPDSGDFLIGERDHVEETKGDGDVNHVRFRNIDTGDSHSRVDIV